MCVSLASAVISPGAEDGKAEPPFKVSHTPKQPKTGERVTISIQGAKELKAADVVLQYQVVEPGKYIALKDAAYAEKWATIGPTKAENAEDSSKAVKFDLPADLQRHRRLIRYRVCASGTKAVIAPAADDPERNFAYFVYDGIPAWQAAINPNGTGTDRKTVKFSAKTMSSVQAYHLISKQQSIENVTWLEPKSYMDPAASEYRYTGTLVANGKVYDHVRFRARGGNWRHAMGKNMWKIDFHKGHHLEARDNWGEKYEKKWAKLNLGACIQQAYYGMRGEQGMFDAISFRLFNLARVEAPHTHWIQLRIVDAPEENPLNQYRGDFWGLYLAMENVDDEFLEGHGLPDGNLYKMDVYGPEPQHIAEGAADDHKDVRQFMSDMKLNHDPEWWKANVDLQRYFSYRSILECIHHYDIGAGKNYYYFNNLKAKRWQVIPWDVDLTWGDHMYGNGAEPFYRAGVLDLEPLNAEYLARLAELRDLLFNAEQTGALIDEFGAVISQPSDGHSMAEADRMKWDYHPVMSSQHSQRGRGDPGLFYKNSPTHDFKGMTELMKRYVERRSQWVDRTLLAEGAFAATPAIAPIGKRENSPAVLNLQLSSPKSARSVKWRVAEFSPANPSGSKTERRGKYEIDPLWEKEAGTSVEFSTKDLKKGHNYRIRARVQDDQGRWSHWSAPEPFTPQ